MIEKSYDDLTLLQFDRLSGEVGLTHAVTTRPQNYAPLRGVGREDAIHWRRRVCEILGVAFESLTAPEQVHGGRVLRIEVYDSIS